MRQGNFQHEDRAKWRIPPRYGWWDTRLTSPLQTCGHTRTWRITRDEIQPLGWQLVCRTQTPHRAQRSWFSFRLFYQVLILTLIKQLSPNNAVSRHTSLLKRFLWQSSTAGMQALGRTIFAALYLIISFSSARSKASRTVCSFHFARRDMISLGFIGCCRSAKTSPRPRSPTSFPKSLHPRNMAGLARWMGKAVSSANTLRKDFYSLLVSQAVAIISIKFGDQNSARNQFRRADYTRNAPNCRNIRFCIRRPVGLPCSRGILGFCQLHPTLHPTVFHGNSLSLIFSLSVSFLLLSLSLSFSLKLPWEVQMSGFSASMAGIWPGWRESGSRQDLELEGNWKKIVLTFDFKPLSGQLPNVVNKYFSNEFENYPSYCLVDGRDTGWEKAYSSLKSAIKCFITCLALDLHWC